MEDFNELGLMYYAAVDSKNNSLARELMERVISKVNEDDSILNLFFKLKISEQMKDDVLADLFLNISENIKMWNTKCLPFDAWVIQVTQTIIRKHKPARNRSYYTKVMPNLNKFVLKDEGSGEVVLYGNETITEREKKTRASELQKRENPEVNRSDLFTIEINQVYLDELLDAFSFRFLQPFFHSKNNQSICVSGIPVWNEDSKKTDYCIVLNYPETMMFESIRKYKVMIIAQQPSGSKKTLEINGSKTIDVSELEIDSLCELKIILEKPKAKAVAVVDDWNSIDTSKLSSLEIEKALKTIFVKGSKLPKLDATTDLTFDQPTKNLNPIYDFNFPLAMAAASEDEDDSGGDWVRGELESFDGCYGEVQASIDIFQPDNTQWLKIRTSVKFPQEMVAILLGEEIKVPGFFVGLLNAEGRICINHLLDLKLVDKDFLVNPKFQLRPFGIEELNSSKLRNNMYACYKAVTQKRHPAFDRYLGLSNDTR